MWKDKGSWKDAYWQASLEDTHTDRREQSGHWMLRQKAETDHGGGEKGEIAVQNAINAGILRSG